MDGLQTTDGWVVRYSGVGELLGAIVRVADLEGPPCIFPSDVSPFDAAEDVEHEDDDHPARNSSFPTGQSDA